VEQARKVGHAIIHDMFEAGTSAIAVAIVRAESSMPIGTLSIAGPSQRMSDTQLKAFAPLLKTAAAQIALAASESTLFADQPSA
jgi:DNA-binding IclR family transcriptional regulator